jgi:hypothetical protein
VLTRNHRQEALCRAYVQAVAALTGLGTSVPTPDYGIDLCLRLIVRRGDQHLDAGVQTDLQLRSTTLANLSATGVRYDLDVRTYESLRGASPVPRLLLVLVLPEEEERWLNLSADELVIRHAAYWMSLRGAAATAATSSIRVTIPRANLFSIEAASALMNRLCRGELL